MIMHLWMLKVLWWCIFDCSFWPSPSPWWCYPITQPYQANEWQRNWREVAYSKDKRNENTPRPMHAGGFMHTNTNHTHTHNGTHYHRAAMYWPCRHRCSSLSSVMPHDGVKATTIVDHRQNFASSSNRIVIIIILVISCRWPLKCWRNGNSLVRESLSLHHDMMQKLLVRFPYDYLLASYEHDW